MKDGEFQEDVASMARANQTSPNPAAYSAANQISHLPELSDHFHLSTRDECAAIIQSAIDEHDRETGVAELRAALRKFIRLFESPVGHEAIMACQQFIYYAPETKIYIKQTRAALGKVE